MISDIRYSPTGVVIGQTLGRPQTAGGPLTSTRSGSVGASVSTGAGRELRVSPSARSLPGSLIAQQARRSGVGLAKPNPLSDKANWQTGGRQTTGAASGTYDPLQKAIFIGAAVVLFMLFKKSK